jgi:RNA polymerase sporulation-specific sigma factor
MILGEVKRYLRDNTSIRIARSVKDTAYKALKIKEELTNLYGREIKVSEIADIMNMKEYEVQDALDAMKDTVSMSTPIYNDGGDTIYLEDQLMDTKGSMYSLETRISLYDALNRIKERERYVLVERYIIGKTQIELSDELGISQAQVSRLEKSGINNIKKLIR